MYERLCYDLLLKGSRPYNQTCRCLQLTVVRGPTPSDLHSTVAIELHGTRYKRASITSGDSCRSSCADASPLLKMGSSSVLVRFAAWTQHEDVL